MYCLVKQQDMFYLKCMIVHDYDKTEIIRLLEKYIYSKDIINLVLDKVAEVFEVCKEDIVSSKRNIDILLVRGVAMYLFRGLGYPFKEIGDIFGGNDGVTVMNGIIFINNKMETDSSLKEKVEKISEEIVYIK